MGMVLPDANHHCPVICGTGSEHRRVTCCSSSVACMILLLVYGYARRLESWPYWKR